MPKAYSVLLNSVNRIMIRASRYSGLISSCHQAKVIPRSQLFSFFSMSGLLLKLDKKTWKCHQIYWLWMLILFCEKYINLPKKIHFFFEVSYKHIKVPSLNTRKLSESDLLIPITLLKSQIVCRKCKTILCYFHFFLLK